MDPGSLLPQDALAAAAGKHVWVKLKWGQEYRGVLAEVDRYMGLRLEQAEELLPGGPEGRGDLVVRGNNVLFLSLPGPGPSPL